MFSLKVATHYRIVLADYEITRIPDELKHPQTPRERQYLKLLQGLLDTVKKDPMTGLQHKQHFQAQDKESGVFIMIDGDGLKRINDQFGHGAGHAAILSISDGIKAALRSGESVTRAGGDEFLVHLEHTTLSAGVAIAKRILDNIRRQKLSHHFEGDAALKPQLDALQLSASLGVGYTEAEADQALYQAKQKGRNRVEFKARAQKAA